MVTCPHCQQTHYQIKDGLTGAGSQRVRCRACNHRYTPDPKPLAYTEDVRTQALKLYVDGLNFRRIARILGVHHQSVINGVNATANRLPDPPPVPSAVETVELDELYSFVGQKKSGSIRNRAGSRHPYVCGLGRGAGTGQRDAPSCRRPIAPSARLLERWVCDVA